MFFSIGCTRTHIISHARKFVFQVIDILRTPISIRLIEYHHVNAQALY